ncbi:MAG: hypothetical protein ACC651_16505 [Candidatus Scalindua sp.]
MIFEYLVSEYGDIQRCRECASVAPLVNVVLASDFGMKSHNRLVCEFCAESKYEVSKTGYDYLDRLTKSINSGNNILLDKLTDRQKEMKNAKLMEK